MTDALRELDAEAWGALLRERGIADAYLLPAYVEASTLLDAGRAVFLHFADAGGEVFFPFILRDVPDDGHGDVTDIVTPYGYGGPVPIGAPSVARFGEALGEWCASRAAVTSFLRFHPLFANERAAPPAVDVIELAGTVAWRVDGEVDLRAGMHSHHRRVVRKATAAGVETRAVTQPDDETLRRFVDLYEITMRRQDAADFYFFPPEYWSALQSGMRDQLVVFEAVLDDQVIAALLCMATAPWLHYHLGATADAARSIGASNALFITAAEWAQSRGFERFHLGGGVGGGDDGLLAFKLRYDQGGLVPFHIGKAVHDRPRYRQLAGSDATDGFFPAYRTPRPTHV